MADTNVFISGATEGSLANAFDGMPPWATQDTAESIQKLLRDSLGIQTKTLAQILKTAKDNGTKLSPKDLNDEIIRLTKGFKSLAAEQDLDKKRRKARRDLDDDDNDATRRGTKLLNIFGTSILTAGLKVKQAFIDNVSTFDKLYASGLNVVDGFSNAATGFEAVQQLAVITGVRFTELSETIIKYNTAVNSFGLAKFAKTFASASKELTQFGYTAKESADLLGSYLESQQGYADTNSKTQFQVQKDLVGFGEKITRLSQATGITRAKLLENVEALSHSIEATILSGQIGQDAAANTLEFISSFKNKDLGQAMLKMMTDVFKPLNTTFMDFQKTGFGGFGQKLIQFTQSLEGLDPEEAAYRTAEFAKANDQEIKMMIQRGNLLSQAGVKEADGMLKVATGLQQQGRTFTFISEEERKKANESAKASKEFQTQWERSLSQLQQAFVPTVPLLLKMASALAWVNTKIEEFAGMFDNSTRSWIGIGLVIASVVGGFKLVSFALDAFGRKLLSLSSPGGSAAGGAGAGSGTGSKRGGRAGGVAGMVAGVGLDYAADALKESGHDVWGATADVASSVASLAGAGALLGSVIPGVGTAIGGIAGGAAGLAYGIYNNWDRISGKTTTPSGSTIRSPSEVGSKPVSAASPSATPATSDNKTGDINQPSSSSDINSILNYQSMILRQLLDNTVSLVSVNRDILKYTKVNS